MKQSILAGISALLMAVLLPMLLLSPAEAETAETGMLIIETPREREAVTEALTATPSPYDAVTEIRLKTGDGVETLSLEEYLTGVVLAEMPASFQLEALKAQAVAARTFTLRQLQAGKHEDADVCGDSGCCQAWIDRASLEAKLGDAWRGYWEKAAQAVGETDGQVLTYDGSLIDAVYFSCSGGTTEPAVAVWGSEIPYLQSVESPGEEVAPRYESEVTVSLDRFRTLLVQERGEADLNGPASGWFGAVTYSGGGGVETMEIGGQVFRGTELRRLFGLNSTLFTVSVARDAVVFEVHGFGHRAGMSQYGANAMAKAGSSYEEILLHYYTGVTLERAPSLVPHP